jgi:uncharacterized RmlC-like cupin family protein
MSTLNQVGSRTTTSVVHPRELISETSQTSGSLRMSAISATQGVASPLWAGIFVVEPSARTGIHHHGEQDTIVYVLEGESIVRWGDHLSSRGGINYDVVKLEIDDPSIPKQIPAMETAAAR